MKKKPFFPILFLSLLLGLVFFLACGEDNLTSLEKAPVEKHSLENKLMLSELDIELIGQLHNRYVQEAFLNFDFQALDKKADLKNAFLKLADREWPNMLDSQTKENLLSLATKKFQLTDYKNYLQKPSIVETYYKDLIRAIGHSNTVDEINNELNKIRAGVLANLDNNDKHLLLIAIEVARNSAKLWAPVENGGLGFLSEYINSGLRDGSDGTVGVGEEEDPELRKWPGWKKVFVADVAGAAGAFMYIGIAGSITLTAIPGTNLALAGAVGFGAAWGSAISALGV